MAGKGSRKQEQVRKPPSLVVVAGKSDDYISVGGIEFMMAPITIEEYVKYLALGDRATEEQQADWLAEKLRARLVNPVAVDPAGITRMWVMQNVPKVLVGTFRYILLNGELPKPKFEDDDEDEGEDENPKD